MSFRVLTIIRLYLGKIKTFLAIYLSCASFSLSSEDVAREKVFEMQLLEQKI